MKIFLTCVLLITCAAVTSAQIKTTIEQLEETYRQYVAWENAGELRYDAELKIITIKNYQIPVAQSTRVKTEKKTVRFSMQKGTAITDVVDASWRRADFTIPFKDKKGASAFVKAFNKLLAEQ